MGRRVNDGDESGLKQDKFRHSRFEHENSNQRYGGVSRSDINTLGNRSAENRGRKGDIPPSHRFNPDSPFENGKISNWGQRQGWDEYYTDKSFRPGRVGGSILNYDENDHSGRGPKGYQRLDDSIFSDVCESLFRSPDVDASDIEVQVNEGIVYLRGTVADRTTKRLAELEIENISGVKDVQNLLTISRGESNAQKH